tara:strand:- start:48 stop:164 length:117 start_codon:yes stop_codon:yes gene_type:complete
MVEVYFSRSQYDKDVTHDKELSFIDSAPLNAYIFSIFL